MPLHPQVKALLDQFEAQGMPSFEEMGVAGGREAIQAFKDLQGVEEPVAAIEERTIPGPGGELLLRIYTPSGSAPHPVVVYFHGGGFLLGDVTTSDKPCRALANASGCTVVSVQYRLAPEHPYPAPLEDCYAATRWVAEHGAEIGVDARRIAVCGDSAGGNLAAAVALKARDEGAPRIAFQALIYPVTDCDYETPSYRDNASGYLLSRDDCRWFFRTYHGGGESRDALAWPLRAASHAGLPPALIVTAEYDPLRDEGERYAEALRAAGVPVRLYRYEGMIHGFYWMGGVVDAGRDVGREVGAAVRDALMVAATA